MKHTRNTPVPDEAQSRRSWRVFVDGSELLRVREVAIDHPRLGTLHYGWTPNGYDGWSFHEEGGGGAVTLPFVRWQGRIFVGLVEQSRPYQGGLVLNAPRGFLDPGERHSEAAARELHEETGMSTSLGRLVALPGDPANPNSTFFETWGDREGCRFFALEMSPQGFSTDGAELRLAESMLDAPAVARAKVEEQILRARFVPWVRAAQVGDMFTNTAVARLIAWVESTTGFEGAPSD